MFIALVPLYIAYGRTAKGWTERTAKECDYVLRSSWQPLHNKEVDSIKKPDILKVLNDIMAEGKLSAANHAFADIRRFFNWIEKLGRFTKGDVTASSARHRCASVASSSPMPKWLPFGWRPKKSAIPMAI